jgi:hypothetical protein
MNRVTAEAAAIAYGAYRGYAGGLHPVTRQPLPEFAKLALPAREAWGRVAIAMKLHWSYEPHPEA